MIDAAAYAIQYLDRADIWMNQTGNLGSKSLCALYPTAEAAQASLDSKRFRRGFRECLAVQPLTAAAIREMSNTVADCLASARRHGAGVQDLLTWSARFEALTDLVPVEV